MAKKNTPTQNSLVKLYMEYVLEHNHAPKSIYIFAKSNGFEEADFEEDAYTDEKAYDNQSYGYKINYVEYDSDGEEQIYSETDRRKTLKDKQKESEPKETDVGVGSLFD